MGILYPFCLLHSEFDKNANSACKRQGDLVISSWFSDLEFAFFVRWLRSAHFLILWRHDMKKSVWIALILMLVCVFSFSACDQGDTPPANDDVCQHTFGDWNTTKQATCKEEGELVRVCSKCSAEEKTTVAKTNVHTEVIDAAVSATCEESGLTEGKHCSYCNKVIVEQTVIGELGHKFLTYVSDGNATTEADGTKTAHCENNGCDKTDTITDAGSRLPANHTHSYTDTVTAPTCTEQGYTTHSCTCGHSYIDTYTNATDHKFVTYVPDGNATTEADGTKTAHCENNGCNKTDTITDVGSKLPSGYSEGLTFVTYRNGYAVSGIGNCADATIVIPSEYNGIPVIAIAEDCFKSKSNIQAIIIPDSVLIIEDYAIAYCKNLNRVDLGNGVKEIGMSFAGCDSLTSIRIPASVEVIDNLAFYLSENFESIVVDEDNAIFSSQDGILYNKAKTEVICCPANNSIKNLTLPSSVVTIGSYAFVNCGNIETITMANNVTTIASSAFKDCHKLENIIMSNNITKIENWAFENCTALKSCVVPNGVTMLYSYVFQDCTSLEWVYVSKNVERMGYDPFDGCNGLKTIYFGGTSTEWSSITYSDTAPSYIGINIIFEYDMSCNHEIVVDEAREPTCTTVGLTEGSHCKICSTVIKAQEEIEKTEHNKEIVSGRVATCSEVGLTEGLACTICGEVFIEQDEIPKLSHTATIVLPYVAPSCSSFGWTEGKKCSVCGEIAVPQEMISKTSHSYDDGVCTVCGNEYTSEGLTVSKYASYNGINRAAVITGYTGTDTEVYIPRYIDGYVVLGINFNAFKNNTKITKVKIPETVTFINGYAFTGCTKLESINIPEAVTSLSGYGIFMDCSSLKSIVIPNSVTELGQSIFQDCTSLETVVLSNKLTELQSQSFLGCSNLQSITIPSALIKIGQYAFNNCSGLKNVVFEGDLKTIEYGGFYYCSALESIVIPKSVTTVGGRAFAGCSKLTIYCEITSQPSGWSSEWNYSDCPVVWNCDDPNSMVNSGTTASGYKWSLNENRTISITGYTGTATNLSIPSTIENLAVTAIGEDAFANNTTIQTIVVPNSIESIAFGAFAGCSSLESISLGTGITSLGNYLFEDCVSLKEFTLPSGETSISGGMFDGCTSLQKVTLLGTIDYIGPNAFNGCTSLTTFSIPNDVQYIGSYAFKNCSSLTGISLPSSLVELKDQAFYGCLGISSVTIPTGVEDIGVGVFAYCANLTSIKSSNTEYIAKNNCLIEKSSNKLLAGCKNSTIPTDGSVIAIEQYAFAGCSSLTSLTIPSKVVYIGAYAFEGCSSLTSVAFSATGGWYRTKNIYSVGATSVSGTLTYVVSASNSATYLKSTYVSYYWHKT